MPQGALKRERDMREAYAAHAEELYGLAVRSLGVARLAEEAVQETFLRAWKQGDRLDPGFDGLRARLFAILREVMIDLGRDRAAAPRVAAGDVEATVERLEQSRLAWQVEEAMRRIDAQHRQILVETCLRSRPYAEVATELGVTEGTVESRVYDGLRALKVALEAVELES
jgi:RNA polymerase sigma-70 factor (ECF subfamily)